jgi:hypothetical protein
MATVIHEDGPEVVHHDHFREVETTGDSGLGSVLAVILALIVIALLLFYGLPLFRSAANRGASGTLNVNLNTGSNGTNGGTTPAPAPTTP